MAEQEAWYIRGSYLMGASETGEQMGIKQVVFCMIIQHTPSRVKQKMKIIFKYKAKKKIEGSLNDGISDFWTGQSLKTEKPWNMS